MLDNVPYTISFASRSEKFYDVTEAQIANKFVFSDFYVAALCNLGFYDMRLIHRAGLATPAIEQSGLIDFKIFMD